MQTLPLEQAYPTGEGTFHDGAHRGKPGFRSLLTLWSVGLNARGAIRTAEAILLVAGGPGAGVAEQGPLLLHMRGRITCLFCFYAPTLGLLTSITDLSFQLHL